jgi:hypothetical protein
VHALRGDFATADAWAADLLAVADASDSVTNALTAYQPLCQYRMVRGDRPGALALAARVAEAATEYGFALHEAGAKLARGWASRDPDELRAASDAIGALGVRLGEPGRYLALADVHRESGRLDDAEAAVAAGLASAADTGERCQLAELHRLRAACARGRGRMDEADAALRLALDVGRTQGATLFVLRAGADLAEIIIARRRLPDARAVLDALCEVATDGAGEDAARVLALRMSLS